MIPDKFNMVDMGGIDMIMMQGEAVPGLYDKLIAAISNCQYQCLYHWMFDSVLIPPTYVQMTVVDGEIYLNGGVSVTSDDVIHIYTISPGPAPPAIIPLLAEENGTYNTPAGVDGFGPVTVDVPSYTPVIEPITITENGNYPAPAGVDGYSPVSVNVSGVKVISRQYWNSLSTSEKRSEGLVVIQDNDSGFYLGEYINSALYNPDIEVISFSAKNAGTSGSLSYEFLDDEDYKIIIAFVQTGDISQANILINNNPSSAIFSEFYNGPSAHLYAANFSATSGDIISITSTGSTNAGVHLLILKGASSVSCVGAAANAQSGISYAALENSHERYLNIIKYGYYSGANTIPSVDLFYSDSSGTTPSIDGSPDYWYGGQYLLKLE